MEPASPQRSLTRNLALLRAVAETKRKKTTPCNLHDVQVARSMLDWREALKERAPPPPDRFVRQLRYKYSGMRVTIRVNDEFVVVEVYAGFDETIACSFGEKPALDGDVKLDRALTALYGHRVFLASNSLAASGNGLLCRPDIQRGLGELRLTGRESLHIRGGEVVLYLQRYELDEVLQAVHSLTNLAASLPLGENEDIALDALPLEFHKLIPLIKRFGITDDEARSERLARISARKMQELVSTVTPQLTAIDNYLDSFGKEPLPEHACVLGALAECVAEARLALARRSSTSKGT